jgi:hypothetical protein
VTVARVRVLLLGLLGACSKPAFDGLPAVDAAARAARPASVSPAAPSHPSQADLAVAKSAAEESRTDPTTEPTTAPKAELKTEEPEENPYSESVTLKVAVTPPAKALVMWGAKQLAKLAPGSMDAEIIRPRGSGPVDLEIKADGYMPYHTRLYTDRDEKANVRLYRTEDAPGLFGYKRSVNPTNQATIPTEKKK